MAVVADLHAGPDDDVRVESRPRPDARAVAEHDARAERHVVAQRRRLARAIAVGSIPGACRDGGYSIGSSGSIASCGFFTTMRARALPCSASSRRHEQDADVPLGRERARTSRSRGRSGASRPARSSGATPLTSRRRIAVQRAADGGRNGLGGEDPRALTAEITRR